MSVATGRGDGAALGDLEARLADVVATRDRANARLVAAWDAGDVDPAEVEQLRRLVVTAQDVLDGVEGEWLAAYRATCPPLTPTRRAHKGRVPQVERFGGAR